MSINSIIIENLWGGKHINFDGNRDVYFHHNGCILVIVNRFDKTILEIPIKLERHKNGGHEKSKKNKALFSEQIESIRKTILIFNNEKSIKYK
jgi:hypothetical protein